MSPDSVNEPQEGCSFCAELAGQEENNFFYQLFGASIGSSYLLERTEHFVVIPAIGSFSPGYLLVLPRRHALSFGRVPPGLSEELEDLLQGIAEWARETYGKSVLMFEHGPASQTARGGSCLDHAHLHISPVPEEIDLKGALLAFSFHEEGSLLAATNRQIQEGRGPYFYLRDQQARSYLCDAPGARSASPSRADPAVRAGGRVGLGSLPWAGVHPHHHPRLSQTRRLLNLFGRRYSPIW